MRLLGVERLLASYPAFTDPCDNPVSIHLGIHQGEPMRTSKPYAELAPLLRMG